jgi:hypothetical protein
VAQQSLGGGSGKRGRIDVRGKGEMVTYLLMGRKTLNEPQVRSVSP